MSRNHRDQRGGHPKRQARSRSGTYGCGCCEIVPPRERSLNRTQRERAARQFKQQAEHAQREGSP